MLQVLPDLPEMLVILFISISVFGLVKIDEIGEFAWRIRRTWFDEGT